MSKPTRIIDIHQHVFWHGRDDAGLVANLDEHGIEKAALLSWVITPLEHAGSYERVFNSVHASTAGHHPGLPFADVMRAVRRYPDRFIVGYCPHPLDPNAVAHMESAIDIMEQAKEIQLPF